MPYQLTEGQWNTIAAAYRVEYPDGRRAFREVCMEPYQVREVEVEIVDVPAPAPVPVPAHYAGLWPLDPRD
jgi:hypothetical protein